MLQPKVRYEYPVPYSRTVRPTEHEHMHTFRVRNAYFPVLGIRTNFPPCKIKGFPPLARGGGDLASQHPARRGGGRYRAARQLYERRTPPPITPTGCGDDCLTRGGLTFAGLHRRPWRGLARSPRAEPPNGLLPPVWTTQTLRISAAPLGSTQITASA